MKLSADDGNVPPTPPLFAKALEKTIMIIENRIFWSHRAERPCSSRGSEQPGAAVLWPWSTPGVMLLQQTGSESDESCCEGEPAQRTPAL